MNEMVKAGEKLQAATRAAAAVAGAAPIAPPAPAVAPPRASTEGARLRLLATLFVTDCLCIASGFALASAIRLGTPAEQGLRTIAVVLPIFVALALSNKAYSITALERVPFGLKRAVQAFLYACAIAITALFYLKWSAEFSRVVFAIGTFASLGFLAVSRWLIGGRIGRNRGWTFRNRLVIADDVTVRPHPGDTIVFADQIGVSPGCADPTVRNRIGELLAGFDSVVLACPPERRREWTYSLQGAAVDVEVLMPELSRMGAVELRILHGDPTLVVSSRPLDIRERVLKRILDLVVATCALIFLAPLMAVFAIAIKAESRGPVFFRQKRIGQNNRMFELLKFRSMHVELNDASGVRSVSRDDDRVTHVGRFMRRTSFDELPQLFNVLSGEMSIVGPRPHALGSTAEDSPFWDVDRRYYKRHAIKPGITGLAQVRGLRGATERRVDLTRRVQADLEYVSGWTLWRDLKIIAATFFVLAHPKAF
jgi:polysaccharide biosynthesis protein PslA